MVGHAQEVRDFARGVDERINVFSAVLGRMTHKLDGLLRRLAIAEEKLVGLVPIVIDTSYEEPSVEFKVGTLGAGQEVLIRDAARTLAPIEEPQVGDSPPFVIAADLSFLFQSFYRPTLNTLFFLLSTFHLRITQDDNETTTKPL
jgi:hypothetical protein